MQNSCSEWVQRICRWLFYSKPIAPASVLEKSFSSSARASWSVSTRVGGISQFSQTSVHLENSIILSSKKAGSCWSSVEFKKPSHGLYVVWTRETDLSKTSSLRGKGPSSSSLHARSTSGKSVGWNSWTWVRKGGNVCMTVSLVAVLLCLLDSEVYELQWTRCCVCTKGQLSVCDTKQCGGQQMR